MNMKNNNNTKSLAVLLAAFAAIAILVATPLALVMQPAYAVGVIIGAKPQADPKDEDGDGAVFQGVIQGGPVKAVEGPTLLKAQEDDERPYGVIIGASPQITNVDEGDDGGDDDTGGCNPDDDVGVC